MALISKTASCNQMMNWYKSANAWHSYTETPKRGDVVIFDWTGAHNGSDHCGIVYGVNADGTIATIEGNTSTTSDDNGGAVMRRTRKKSLITGYGRPSYTTDDEIEKYVALALAQVGTKENPSGSNKVKYNTWYYGKEVSGSAYPWCAAFVSWVFLSNASADDSTSETKTSETETSESKSGYFDISVRQLSTGKKGTDVKAWQRLLIGAGYSCGSAGVDGSFGSATKSATIKFQKAKGIEQDGIVGKITLSAMLGYDV